MMVVFIGLLGLNTCRKISLVTLMLAMNMYVEVRIDLLIYCRPVVLNFLSGSTKVKCF